MVNNHRKIVLLLPELGHKRPWVERNSPPVATAMFLLAILSFRVYNLKKLLSPALAFVKFLTFKATMTAFMYDANNLKPKMLQRLNNPTHLKYIEK